MEFKIVQKPAFYLAGVTKRVPIQFTGKNAAIVELAQSITANQRAHMDALKDMEPYAVLNASYDFDTGRMEESGELTQMIGVATTQAQVPDDLTRVAVAEHTWAIFPSRGVFPATMQTTWGQIYAEWLPQSGYELVAAPEIAYVDYTTPAENRSTEIWIAVQKIADSE